jgi:hypothetical protein
MRILFYGLVFLLVAQLIFFSQDSPKCHASGYVPYQGHGLPSLPGAYHRRALPYFKSNSGLSGGLYAGWLEHPQGLSLSNDLPSILGGIENIRRRPLRGIFGSLILSKDVWDNLSLELGASMLFGLPSDGLITSNIGLTADFQGDATQWSYVQSLVKWEMTPSLSILAGARWDNTQTRFHVIRPPTGNDDFTMNLFTPIMGLQAQSGVGLSEITIRAMGFPVALGNIKFHTWSEISTYSQTSDQDFNRGYLLEIQAIWNGRVTRSLDFSIYGGWNLFHGVTRVEEALVPAPVADIRWVADRRSWVIGLGISWDLALP